MNEKKVHRRRFPTNSPAIILIAAFINSCILYITASRYDSTPSGVVLSYPPWSNARLPPKSAVLHAAIRHAVHPERGNVIDHHTSHFQLVPGVECMVYILCENTCLETISTVIYSCNRLFEIIKGSIVATGPKTSRQLTRSAGLTFSSQVASMKTPSRFPPQRSFAP